MPSSPAFTLQAIKSRVLHRSWQPTTYVTIFYHACGMCFRLAATMASLPYSCRAVFSGAQGSMEITEDALVWQKEGYVKCFRDGAWDVWTCCVTYSVWCRRGPRQTLVAWADVTKHAVREALHD